MPSFSPKSLNKLSTLHPDLQRVLQKVILHVDFTILEGHRNEADQNAAVARGASKARWPLSKHNSLPSKAVDVAPWPVDWQDTPRFNYLAGFILGVASELGVRLWWGGTFTGLVDRPHFELVL